MSDFPLVHGVVWDRLRRKRSTVEEFLARRGGKAQAELRLTAEGVLRYLWESGYGSIRIEHGRTYVNVRTRQFR